MASSKEYLHYILGQLRELDDISYRAMMGEYIIYYRGKIAAYVCDNQLLVKPVAPARALLPEAPLTPPYEGAKEMLLVEQTDQPDFLMKLLEASYPALPEPKKKK